VNYNLVRNYLFSSKAFVIARFLVRLRQIFLFNLNNFFTTTNWLIKEREFTNYFYEISDINKKYLITFLSNITECDETKINNFFSEIENDIEFNTYISDQLRKNSRGSEIALPLLLGRRLAWYALIRIFKPEVVVETGTDKGIGTLVMARALERNRSGKIFTLDSDPFAGALIDLNKWTNIEFLKGNSIKLLNEFKTIDFFIHDSNHDYSYEYSEFNSIEGKLSPSSVVLSDNSHISEALLDWSTKHGRRFYFFKEQSINHWHAGDGLGVSL